VWQVFLLDTLGELQELYALATIVFVGGSLVPKGGHNVLEAAVWSKPVLFGPYTSNFASVVVKLKTAGCGREVRTAEELEDAALRWLNMPEEREKMGKRAAEIVAENLGAADRAMSIVARYLDGAVECERRGVGLARLTYPHS